MGVGSVWGTFKLQHPPWSSEKPLFFLSNINPQRSTSGMATSGNEDLVGILSIVFQEFVTVSSLSQEPPPVYPNLFEGTKWRGTKESPEKRHFALFHTVASRRKTMGLGAGLLRIVAGPLTFRGE